MSDYPMRKLLKLVLLSSVLSLGSNALHAQALALNPSLPLGDTTVRGAGCVGGEIYDDGTAENGYSGNAGIISQFEGVQRFTPASYPGTYQEVCVGLVSLGGPNLDFEIEVRDDDGPGGSPGTLLGALPVSATGIPGGLPCQFYSYDISSLNLNITSGSVHIGVRWNPMAFPSRFICGDETPATPLHLGHVNFNNPSNWQTTQTVFPAYRAKLIRAVGGSAAPELQLGNVTFLDMCSTVPANNNSIIEPGEVINFSIPINAVNGPFTNVNGMLSSSTPGVTILSGMGSYGNIAQGSSATAVYSISLAESVACNSALNLTLNVTSTEGPFSFPITRNVGQSGTIVYNNLPLSIPDNVPAGASSTANVAGVPGPLTSVQVRVATTHTWVGDLIYRLTSPSGTVITLLDRPGVPAGAAGCNNNDVNVTFADGQPDPEAICTGNTADPWPVTLAAPVTALSTLNGENANGTWTLTVSDNAGADTGTLSSWELILVPAPAGTCNVCPNGADLSITLTDSPDPVAAGSNLTYVATITNNGPAAAQDVSVSLPLPATTTFVSATPSAGGTCNAASPVVCTWAGATAPAGVRTVTVVAAVSPSASGPLSATATASSPTADLNPANNTATATTAVSVSADLALTLTASSTTAALNEPVTFTASSTNLGPSDAQNVQITITLSPDFRFSSLTASAGATCTSPQIGTSGVITCTWAGATAPGATRTLAVAAFSNSPGNSSISASTSATGVDPVLANNQASVAVTVGVVTAPIPSLDLRAMILLGLMLGLLGWVAIRRQ